MMVVVVVDVAIVDVVVDVAFILSSFLSTANSFQCTNLGDKTLTLVY
jgi:hypothetical protein